MPDTPNPAALIQAILDELVAEINDPRMLPQGPLRRRVESETTMTDDLGNPDALTDHQRLRSLAREKAAFALYPIMEREGLEGLQLIAAGELANAAIEAFEQVMRRGLKARQP